MVESLPTARILLLVTYRPEYQHTWGSRTYYTQLRLNPLRQEEAHDLLTALLGEGPGLHALKELMLAKTAGNPFFMEEIVQTLVEQGLLVREVAAGGHATMTRLTGSLTALQLPPTVQGVLAARIDRLAEEEKALLQILAVIGRAFPLSLLTHVVGQPEEEVQGLLTRLQRGEFIFEQPAFPELEYTFKHPLTQEVAYHSLLMERRRALHERTAQAIEALFQDRLEDHYSELTHHYSRSGNTAKAVEYLQRAGQQAVQCAAYAEAISHVTTALDLLGTLPDTLDRDQQELVLQTTLAQAWGATKGVASPEVERAATRARALCQQVGETRHLFPVLSVLERMYRLRAELSTARELAEQLLHLAQRMPDSVYLAQAHAMLGLNMYAHGELGAARAHLEQAMVIYGAQSHGVQAVRSLPSSWVWVSCLSYVAWVLWLLGYPDQALARSQEALTLAQEQQHPYSLVHALGFAAGLHQFRREKAAAQARAEAAIILATEQGFPFWGEMGTMRRGWALAAQGHGEEGIAQIQQGLAAMQAAGVKLGCAHWLALLAEAYGHVGETQEGLSVLAEALATVHNCGGRWWEAELYRLKGELLLRQAGGQGGETETCLQYAFTVARRQQAKSLELRAAMSLAHLWQQQGKREEARQLLVEVYSWFTEGFDTADLQEAKALLEELRG